MGGMICYINKGLLPKTIRESRHLPDVLAAMKNAPPSDQLVLWSFMLLAVDQVRRARQIEAAVA